MLRIVHTLRDAFVCVAMSNEFKVKETFRRDLSHGASHAINSAFLVHEKTAELETCHSEIQKDDTRRRLCSPYLAANFERLRLHFVTIDIIARTRTIVCHSIIAVCV